MDRKKAFPKIDLSEWITRHILPIFVILGIMVWVMGRFGHNWFEGSGVAILVILIFFGYLLKHAVSSKIKAEENFHELVQYSNSIIMRMDGKGNITFFNRFAQDFFGFTEKEILGRNVLDTIVPRTETTGKDLEKMIEDIITSSEKYKININENMRKNGERVWVIWTNKSFSAPRNKKEVMCIGSDMTKIKEAEAKLKEAMDIKDRFVSMASHELRSPLAAIKGAIDLVSDILGDPLTENQKHWMVVAKSYITRLNRIADDILTVQKLEAGKMVFEMTENDLNATISDVVSIMKNPASEKGLELLADLDKGLPKFTFDKDRIIQVMINLINNAIKFTDKGSIKVSTSSDKDFAKVAVADTGCGMKREEIPKVFQKFEQLNNARERKSGGTGLGLSIAKDIVLNHGGDIGVESEEGRGTTFYFKLPLKRAASS